MSIDRGEKPDNYFRVVRKEMLPFVPRSAKVILEIGCADGNFGELLLNNGANEVWGIEYEEVQGKLAENKITKVLIGDVEEMIFSLPNHYFDAVVCNDVIEHLVDPYTVIRELKPKLKNEGVVISSIPNIRYFRNLFDYFFNKNWDYTSSGIMDKTHLRFFTYKSIRKMFENEGYEIVKMKGINKTSSIRPIIWNMFYFGSFWDIKYLQFATVAKVKLT